MTNHEKIIVVTGPYLPFFHRRKGKLKIDQSVKRRDIGSVRELHAPTRWLLVACNTGVLLWKVCVLQAPAHRLL